MLHYLCSPKVGKLIEKINLANLVKLLDRHQLKVKSDPKINLTV